MKVSLFRRLPVQLTGLALLLGASVGSTPPVSAASACDTANIEVEFLGVGASNTILVAAGSGYFEGNVLVHVFCGIDGSPVTNAVIGMWTTVNGSGVYDPAAGTWQDATNAQNPVHISVPTGDQQIAIRAADPNLTGWRARVGADTVTVTQAFGHVITDPTDPSYPNANAGIWAQTPELDSLALFGSGAASLIGYALLRRRAAGGKNKKQA